MTSRRALFIRCSYFLAIIQPGWKCISVVTFYLQQFTPQKFPFYNIIGPGWEVQKLPFENVLRDKCSLKFRKIHLKTSVLKSIFYNYVIKEQCWFIKKRLQHRCFPINFLKFLSTGVYLLILWNFHELF